MASLQQKPDIRYQKSSKWKKKKKKQQQNNHTNQK